MAEDKIIIHNDSNLPPHEVLNIVSFIMSPDNPRNIPPKSPERAYPIYKSPTMIILHNRPVKGREASGRLGKLDTFYVMKGIV